MPEESGFFFFFAKLGPNVDLFGKTCFVLFKQIMVAIIHKNIEKNK